MDHRPKDESHNTGWTVRVSNPFQRPGVEFESEPVSEEYVVATVRKGMEMAREVNRQEAEAEEE